MPLLLGCGLHELGELGGAALAQLVARGKLEELLQHVRILRRALGLQTCARPPR
jgi:hypothetical protein